MFLDVVFVDEVRDYSWVFKGLGAASINRAVDEMLDAVFDCLVNEVYSLGLFGRTISDRNLN
jgi:hypothetical protein